TFCSVFSLSSALSSSLSSSSLSSLSSSSSSFSSGLNGTVNVTLCAFGGCSSGPSETYTDSSLPICTSESASGDCLIIYPSSTSSECFSLTFNVKSLLLANASASLSFKPVNWLILIVLGPSLVSNITLLSLGTTSSPLIG